MIGRATLTGALVVFSFGLANAADRAAGLNSARTLCVNCHVVEPGAAKQNTLTAGVPSFKAIAEKRGQTEEDIKLFMLNPSPADAAGATLHPRTRKPGELHHVPERGALGWFPTAMMG